MAHTIEMSIQDWIDVDDNPRQRNTHRRAKAARSKHLSSLQKIHRFVYAATLNGTVRWKLDGHTRALLWELGELDQTPDGQVTVILVPVQTKKEAAEIYLQLDNAGVGKGPSDTLFSACRENNFELVSPLLRTCKFSTQLKFAACGGKYRGDVFALVKNWKSILLLLDSFGLTSKNTVLIAAMLVSLRDDESTAESFWKAVDADAGTRNSKGSDGADLVCRMLEVRRAEGTTAGWDNLVDMNSRAYQGYLMWKDGKRGKQLRRNRAYQDAVMELK